MATKSLRHLEAQLNYYKRNQAARQAYLRNKYAAFKTPCNVKLKYYRDAVNKILPIKRQYMKLISHIKPAYWVYADGTLTIKSVENKDYQFNLRSNKVRQDVYEKYKLLLEACIVHSWETIDYNTLLPIK